MRKKAFDNDKELKKQQAIINGAVAVTSILADYPKGDFGVAAALAIVAATATTAFQVAKINETEYEPRYATGGLVEGPGTGTSDSIRARLSNGEFVVNAKSTQQYLPVLEAINSNSPMVMDNSKMLEVLGKLEMKMSEPSKAYVLQGDIYNGVQAQYQINSKRKL